VKLIPVDWDEGCHRWRDIATNLYASDRKAVYAYADAVVTLEYEEGAPTFTGILVASGLKPNFAYQIKLNGKPEYFGDDGDDWANEQFGRLGRWWARQIRKSDGAIVKQWRSDDEEYDRWKAQAFADGVHDYVFEGYLLFDYLVTDAAGAASKPLQLDSSFHVLWKRSQREPGPSDSTPTPHSIVVQGESDWYGQDRPTQEVELYAEWEPGRARPGELALPPGRYNVQLVLTEESFHEREPESGSWATVLAAENVVFSRS